MRHKTKIWRGIIIFSSFCILQCWKEEFILQCFNPITHCYFNKCFKREYSKDGWLVASKPKICGDYKAGTFLLYNIDMVGNINSQSIKRGSCWDQVCRVTQSTASLPNQLSPQRTMMQHQPQNSLMPLRYTQTSTSSCLSESNAVQLVAA